MLKKGHDDHFNVDNLLTIDSPCNRTLEDRFDSSELKSISRSDNCWRIEAVFQACSSRCPICQRNMQIHEWTRGRSPYFDVPYEDLPVHIFVTRPRLRCRECDITRTSFIPSLVEGHRVTQELVTFLPSALLSSTSLRGLAKRVGLSLAVLRNLLKEIAQDAQSVALMPSKFGIHEFHLGKRVHLVASNLEFGSIVAFFPAGPSQLTSLAMFLKSDDGKTKVQEIIVPADIEILEAVFEGHTCRNCFCSLTSIHELMISVLASVAKLRSRKGRSGSISMHEALEIAKLRLHGLSQEQHQLCMNGLRVEDPFWTSFAAKEELIEAIQENNSMEWVEIVTTWYRNLSAVQQVNFGQVVSEIIKIREFSPAICSDLIFNRIEENLKILEKMFVKPGVRFSDEMIWAILMASPWTRVEIPRKFGQKGARSLWLEEPTPTELRQEATHGGIHLETLVVLLSAFGNMLGNVNSEVRGGSKSKRASFR